MHALGVFVCRAACAQAVRQHAVRLKNACSNCVTSWLCAGTADAAAQSNADPQGDTQPVGTDVDYRTWLETVLPGSPITEPLIVAREAAGLQGSEAHVGAGCDKIRVNLEGMFREMLTEGVTKLGLADAWDQVVDKLDLRASMLSIKARDGDVVSHVAMHAFEHIEEAWQDYLRNGGVLGAVLS